MPVTEVEVTHSILLRTDYNSDSEGTELGQTSILLYRSMNKIKQKHHTIGAITKHNYKQQNHHLRTDSSWNGDIDWSN